MIFFKSFGEILCLSLNCVSANIFFLNIIILPSNHEQHAKHIRKLFELGIVDYYIWERSVVCLSNKEYLYLIMNHNDILKEKYEFS